MTAIARQFGVSVTSVSVALARTGIPTRPFTSRNWARAEAICAAYLSGQSGPAVARRFGLHDNRVYAILDGHGVSRRVAPQTVILIADGWLAARLGQANRSPTSPLLRAARRRRCAPPPTVSACNGRADLLTPSCRIGTGCSIVTSPSVDRWTPSPPRSEPPVPPSLTPYTVITSAAKPALPGPNSSTTLDGWPASTSNGGAGRPNSPPSWASPSRRCTTRWTATASASPAPPSPSRRRSMAAPRVHRRTPHRPLHRRRDRTCVEDRRRGLAPPRHPAPTTQATAAPIPPGGLAALRNGRRCRPPLRRHLTPGRAMARRRRHRPASAPLIARSSFDAVRAMLHDVPSSIGTRPNSHPAQQLTRTSRSAPGQAAPATSAPPPATAAETRPGGASSHSRRTEHTRGERSAEA